MKALLLTNEYPPHVYGGAGVHVEYLARALATLIDVEVRCFGNQDDARGSLHVKGYGVDVRRFAQIGAELRAPLEALDRCISFVAVPTDADLVHCHTWYTYLGGIVTKIAGGLPLVITAHSLEPLRAWKRAQLGRGYDLSSWLEKAAIEMADRIIAVSDGMRQDILRFFDVDPGRITVIHNGIDTDEYRPVSTREALVKYDVDPDLPYVLFVGRLTQQKGIVHLIRAIDYLPPGIQVVLCAGTPDTGEIEHQVAAAVRRVQAVRPHVVWIGEMIEKRAAIELYSHAAVFCCPSIYEPFGIINLEAMACGVPVVASAVGGIPEVVVAGETGLLVPFDQHADTGEPVDAQGFARDLAAAINRLMVDEALRCRLGSAGRERALRLFGWRAIAHKVVRLYEAVVRAPQPHGGGTPGARPT